MGEECQGEQDSRGDFPEQLHGMMSRPADGSPKETLGDARSSGVRYPLATRSISEIDQFE